LRQPVRLTSLEARRSSLAISDRTPCIWRSGAKVRWYASGDLGCAAASHRTDLGDRRAGFGRGDPCVVDQWMVNGADAATSYGVVVSLFNWTRYEPGSTEGGPAALMSPWVLASVETGNVTVTGFD